MDDIAHKLLAKTFPYTDVNSDALRVMSQRIAEAARKKGGGTLTYGELVKDVPLHMGSREFTISARGFTANNRRLLSWLLGHLSKQSYLQGEFFASALVVDKKTRKPGTLFFRFVHELGALNEQTPEAESRFWQAQRLKAHEFYARSAREEHPFVAAHLPEFLCRSSDDYIRLAGHRIGLSQVVASYREGFSAEMIREQFPTLPLSLIHKVLGFYLESRDWIDRYVDKEQMDVERQRVGSRNAPSLEELRRRYRQRHARAG